MRRFLFLAGILFFGACAGSGESNDSLKKAVIYYDPNEVPWGILKIISIYGREFLKHSSLDKLTITDCDSLKYIQDLVGHAIQDTVKQGDQQYVDTSIAVMLYSDQKTDTLFLDGSSHLQCNDCIFQDKTLTHYIIKIIRLNNTYWEELGSEYYYNGKYNGVSRLLYPDEIPAEEY